MTGQVKRSPPPTSASLRAHGDISVAVNTVGTDTRDKKSLSGILYLGMLRKFLRRDGRGRGVFKEGTLNGDVWKPLF